MSVCLSACLSVLFVPYTLGSELAKRMRAAEEKLMEMTGYKLKIVERSGTKLEDILHKADPWQGQYCGREMCLLCQTKKYTGKHLTQDCFRRSLVYETWCISCQEKELEKIETEAGNDKKRKGELTKNMKLHKYIGETNRSCFERGREHLNDFGNLSTKSHMLKHAVEVHKDEEASNLKFGM